MEEPRHTSPTPDTGLIYGLNDRPPFKEAFFAALQHLLAIFVAIITPPLIIAGALKLDAETTGYLVSMALFASGISTFVQCRRFGCIGTGLLCIQGTSFSFIGPIIAAGMAGGLPLIFGSCMAASCVEMVISRVLKYTRRIITPLISGIVVTLIGMSLIKVGITACGGGAVAQADGTFGSLRHVGLAALVLVLIIFFNRSGNRYLRMSSIVIGLIIGYAVAHGPEDADLRALEWRKYPSADVYQPLMRSSDKAEGVGHNSVICDGGRYYVVYHGRQAGTHEAPGEDLRLARIDEMRIDGDRLSVIIT